MKGMSRVAGRVHQLAAHCAAGDPDLDARNMTVETKGTHLVVQWTGPYHLQLVWGEQSVPAAITRNASLGFSDGAPGIVVIQDPTQGRMRPYFRLVEPYSKTPSKTFAERALPLKDPSLRVRDLGGLHASPASDMKSVRWGVFFRHAGLGSMGAEDAAYVKRLGLKVSAP
jgi:hypothetical protein